MELEIKKLIFDLDRAINLIQIYIQGKQFTDYQADSLLRSAVERQFEIVGEALNRLYRIDPEIVARISDYQRIIGFRNVLVHGYDVVSDVIVWDIVLNKLPVLRRDVDNIKHDYHME